MGKLACRWAGAAFRVFAIGVEFGERGKRGAGFGAFERGLICRGVMSLRVDSDC